MRPEHVLDLFLRADHGSHSVEQGLAFVKFLEDLVLGGDQVSDDLLEVGSTFGHLFFSESVVQSRVRSVPGHGRGPS